MSTKWEDLPLIQHKLLFSDTASIPKPYAIVPCLLCTKPFQMLPFIGQPDQVCPECFYTYRDAAKLVCAKCEKQPVIGRLKPKQLDNGFYIKPKSTLHSDKCNVCCPGLVESTIVEIEEWERKIRPKKIIIAHR